MFLLYEFDFLALEVSWMPTLLLVLRTLGIYIGTTQGVFMISHVNPKLLIY